MSEAQTGLSWEDWARMLGRDPAELDVDEILMADMRLGAERRRLRGKPVQADVQTA